MAAKSSLKNMLLCLTGVCLACSALLAFTYAMTTEPIAAAQQAKTSASIARVLPAFEGTPELLTAEVDGQPFSYYKADGAGYAVLVSVSGFGGPLSMMVGIREDGCVHNTVVLSHNETPGLGAKCQTDTKFIDQFKGFDPSVKKLAVKKDGGDVDAITASTITSRAYTFAVATAEKVYSAIAAQGGQDNE